MIEEFTVKARVPTVMWSHQDVHVRDAGPEIGPSVRVPPKIELRCRLVTGFLEPPYSMTVTTLWLLRLLWGQVVGMNVTIIQAEAGAPATSRRWYRLLSTQAPGRSPKKKQNGEIGLWKQVSR